MTQRRWNGQRKNKNREEERKIERKESLGTKKGKNERGMNSKKEENCVCEDVICATEIREEKRTKSKIKI